MGERGSQKGVPTHSECLKDPQSFEEHMYCDPIVLQWLLITLFLGPKLNVRASPKKNHTSNINSSEDLHPAVRYC